MPKSTISQFDLNDKRYIASQVVSNSSSVEENEPFEYDATFPSDKPYQEQMRLSIDPTGQSAQEVINGVTVSYGGVFEGKGSQISISGDGLSEDDKKFIKSRISFSNQSGGNDLLVISAKDIAMRKPDGIQYFDITIPYIEQEVQYTVSEQDVDMMLISHSGSLINEASISITGTDNPVVNIDLGIVQGEYESFQIKDITNYDSGISIYSTIPSSLDSIDFEIKYTLNGETGFRIIDTHAQYAYKINNYSTYVYCNSTLDVSEYGNTKYFDLGIERIVQGSDKRVFYIESEFGAWNNLDIRVYTSSYWPTYKRILEIDGTLSSNSFDALGFTGTNNTYQYKITYLSSEDKYEITVRNNVTSKTFVYDSGDPIYKVTLSNWQSNFGNTLRLDVKSKFKNMPMNMLRVTSGFVNCGLVWTWNKVDLDGSSYSFSTEFQYEGSSTSNFGNILYRLGYNQTTSRQIDGFGAIVRPLCGDEWLNEYAVQIDEFGWTDISSGSSFEIGCSSGTTISQASVEYNISESKTIYDLCQDLSNLLSDNAPNIPIEVSISPNPSHSNLSVFSVTNGSYTSPNEPASVNNIIINGSYTDYKTFTLNEEDTLANLRDEINSDDIMKEVVFCSVLNGYNNESQKNLLESAYQKISRDGTIYISNIDSSLNFSYSTINYSSTDSLASAMNSNLGVYGISVVSYSDYNPLDINEIFPAKSFYQSSLTITGTTEYDPDPSPPSYDFTVNCNIKYASGSDPGEDKGVQVSLGGYEKNGVFYPNESPNTFFEPDYNTEFPIEFQVQEADVVYLLVRTRMNDDGNSFSIMEGDYECVVTYSNGSKKELIYGYKPTDSLYTDAWTEDFGMPVVIAIPAKSVKMNVMIQDSARADSLSLVIKNMPSEINDFGFLAINRTNLSNSQTESKNSMSYGLVLDNRGAWDILIAPEAIMYKNSSGQFSHLNTYYAYEAEDADESWDFEFLDESLIPDEVKPFVSLSSVPNYSKVWILRIEHGLKEYLKSLRKNAEEGSNEGCSIYFDILVTGRDSGIQGVCRVYVYYDYTCVYDVGLCDFYWNMIDPPKPAKPQYIDGRLDFVYQSLVDCSLIDFDGSTEDITEIDIPVMVTVKNIPTFKNGNALLLMKGRYTSEIQGFYFPTEDQLDNLKFENCNALSETLPLASRVNRETLWLPNGDVITDINEINSKLKTEKSYMWIRPALHFPVDDKIKECAEDEIVIVGIGYQFKNWVNGNREENFICGVNLYLPVGIITTPEMALCYKFYYNQTEG